MIGISNANNAEKKLKMYHIKGSQNLNSGHNKMKEVTLPSGLYSITGYSDINISVANNMHNLDLNIYGENQSSLRVNVRNDSLNGGGCCACMQYNVVSSARLEIWSYKYLSQATIVNYELEIVRLGDAVDSVEEL